MLKLKTAATGAIVAFVASLGAAGMAGTAHASYGGGCDLEAHGTKGNVSLTEHVTADTCEQQVRAWALCQPFLPMSWPSIATGPQINRAPGDIWVGCTAAYVVSGGYEYQPTYGSGWVRVQNT